MKHYAEVLVLGLVVVFKDCVLSWILVKRNTPDRLALNLDFLFTNCQIIGIADTRAACRVCST